MLRKLKGLTGGVFVLTVMMAACRGAEQEATAAAISAAQTAINAASSEAASMRRISSRRHRIPCRVPRTLWPRAITLPL